MPAPLGHEPYPGCETGGRPKKYTPEFIENEADELKKWMKDNKNLFIENFCLERGYHDSRIPEFVEANEKFSDAYSMLKMKQKIALFQGGLTKKFAYPMCALILSHSHGVIAKTEQKLSGDSVNPLAFVLNNVDGTSKELLNNDEH